MVLRLEPSTAITTYVSDLNSPVTAEGFGISPDGEIIVFIEGNKLMAKDMSANVTVEVETLTNPPHYSESMPATDGVSAVWVDDGQVWKKVINWQP
jgi:hypothetical protein